MRGRPVTQSSAALIRSRGTAVQSLNSRSAASSSRVYSNRTLSDGWISENTLRSKSAILEIQEGLTPRELEVIAFRLHSGGQEPNVSLDGIPLVEVFDLGDFLFQQIQIIQNGVYPARSARGAEVDTDGRLEVFAILAALPSR